MPKQFKANIMLDINGLPSGNAMTLPEPEPIGPETFDRYEIFILKYLGIREDEREGLQNDLSFDELATMLRDFHQETILINIKNKRNG